MCLSQGVADAELLLKLSHRVDGPRYRTKVSGEPRYLVGERIWPRS